ncbi:MAG: lipopolysaccharide biosynthesis protein [Bauldia sp.]|nr:lipopolysaccharide biosynthesis protein [Bauldia sp.]
MNAQPKFKIAPIRLTPSKARGVRRVRLSFAGIAGRVRPAALRNRVLPFAHSLDGVFASTDERSVSRRISLIAFAIRIASAVIALGSQVFMARWMGEHEYGVFVVVWTAAVVVGGLSCLGFQMSVVRFIPEYLERKEYGILRGLIVGARAYGFASASVIALLGVLGIWLLGDRLASYYVAPFYLAAVCLPILAVGEIQDGMSRAFNWVSVALWPLFIYRPLAVLAFMWIAMMSGAPANAVTAMYATIGAVYLVTAYQAWGLRRRIKRVVPAAPRSYKPVHWIAISLPIFIVEGFFNLLTNVDILIVGALLEPQQAGVYFAAVKALALIHFVYFAVRAGAAQRISAYYASGDQTKLQAFIRDTLHWTFWPSLLVSIILLILGKPILSLFGEGFVEGYPLFFAFIAGLLVRASVGPAESILTMAGEQRICAVVYAVVFALNVALNFILVPIMGLQGAAIATATAISIEAIALAIVIYRRLGILCWIGFVLIPPRRPAEVS